MAGRNVSATHVAFASTRVMATCAVMGQAAGTAAAWCAREALTPRQLAGDARHLTALKQALLKDDCYLLGTRNEDTLDLARRARASASGELECHGAAKVLSGVTRQVQGESHQWAGPLGSDGGGGATLRLDWPQPVTLAEVRLVFDSGFARPLTLTTIGWPSSRSSTEQASTSNSSRLSRPLMT